MKDKTKDLIIAGIAILALIGLIYFAMNLLKLPQDNPNQEPLFLVVNVTDGDTFTIATGEIVRLICVDTPEKDEENYTKAKDFLSSLILGEEVRLEQDENASASEGYDKYNRLLRYAYLNTSEGELFINKEIVQKGYGMLFPYGNSTSRCEEIGEKE